MASPAQNLIDALRAAGVNISAGSAEEQKIRDAFAGTRGSRDISGLTSDIANLIQSIQELNRVSDTSAAAAENNAMRQKRVLELQLELDEQRLEKAQKLLFNKGDLNDLTAAERTEIDKLLDGEEQSLKNISKRLEKQKLINQAVRSLKK